MEEKRILEYCSAGSRAASEHSWVATILIFAIIGILLAALVVLVCALFYSILHFTSP